MCDKWFSTDEVYIVKFLYFSFLFIFEQNKKWVHTLISFGMLTEIELELYIKLLAMRVN